MERRREKGVPGSGGGEGSCPLNSVPDTLPLMLTHGSRCIVSAHRKWGANVWAFPMHSVDLSWGERVARGVEWRLRGTEIIKERDGGKGKNE